MGLAPGPHLEKPEKNGLPRVSAMKMGQAPIRTIGACPIFMIQGAAPQHEHCPIFSQPRIRGCDSDVSGRFAATA